ncbi:MAG: DNA polymerase III subunit delta, partial [Eubacterium sp.]|nr:DNA polymerase III subunit delta [Eubacterium sp.]
MKEISKNIKEGQFHKVYLLTGDEGYLIFQASQMLRSALLHEGDEMNFTRYEEAKIDLPQLADLAATFPFFSQKRVILFNYTNILKTGKEEFLKILQNLP